MCIVVYINSSPIYYLCRQLFYLDENLHNDNLFCTLCTRVFYFILPLQFSITACRKSISINYFLTTCIANTQSRTSTILDSLVTKIIIVQMKQHSSRKINLTGVLLLEFVFFSFPPPHKILHQQTVFEHSMQSTCKKKNHLPPFSFT